MPLWAAGLAAALLVARACPTCAQTPASSVAGFDVSAQLRHGAYDIQGAPNVVVHVPPKFDARGPLQIVVFLHGFSGCVSVLMGKGPSRCRAGAPQQVGWDLGRYHDAAHTQTLFVVPQLAFMKRDGRPGRFAHQGGFRAFLEELLRGPLVEPLGGPRALRDVARIDIVAHSAGYQAALAILEHGGVDPSLIRSVTLLDALYGEAAGFARYVERHAAELQFVVISLPNGTPAREARRLARRLTQRLGRDRVTRIDRDGIADAIADHPIVFAQGRPPHRAMPATYLAEVLAALHRKSAR